MVDPGFDFRSIMSQRMPMMVDDIKITTLAASEEEKIIALVRRNMENFDAAEAVLAATFRRLSNLYTVYSHPGAQLFIATLSEDRERPIACAGLGPLHGLPLSEGIGEIRDLVVDAAYRGQGIGSRLLHRCIDEAKQLGYQRLYLETSKNMVNARKLFLRSGFRPVLASGTADSDKSDLPCYFLLENLSKSRP